MVERIVVLVLVQILTVDQNAGHEVEVADIQDQGRAATAGDIHGLVQGATTGADPRDMRGLNDTVTIGAVANLQCRADVVTLVTGSIPEPADALVFLD